LNFTPSSPSPAVLSLSAIVTCFCPVAGSPDLHFLKAMRAEHMTRAGYNHTFVTGNYKLTTQAYKEWLYVAGDEKGNRLIPPESDMVGGRVIPDIDHLLGKKLAVTAGLTREEMIAIVLYTGPAFVIYNAVLRQFPDDIYQVFKVGKNLFPTTIFVLVSAINKLSRCADIPRGTLLYRGLGGTLEFPDSFTRADPKCKTPDALGFLEYGFMSTSADRNVAVQYSGAKEGKPKAGILQIHPNAVDRGADISGFSQYPAEREFLFVPYSFIQSEGRQRTEVLDGGGVLTVVSVRVNVNLKTETVEELKTKKKQLHLASAHAMVEELRCELGEWAAAPSAAERLLQDSTRGDTFTTTTLADAIVNQCEAVVKRHQEVVVEDYVDDGVFRALVSEMLDTKAWAKEKTQLWMRDATQFISQVQIWSLRDCHRLWLSFLRQRVSAAAFHSSERASASLELLMSRGLVKRGVSGEANADGEDVMVQAGGDGWAQGDIAAAAAAGADIGAIDINGCNGVWNAARYGHADSISMLVAVSGDVNMCSNDGMARRSPMFIAARNGHADCLKLLISAGGEVNKCDIFGTSPLFTAAQKGRTNCLKLLISAGGDVHKCNTSGGHYLPGASPIWVAASSGRADCLTLLISAGGDVNKCDDAGTSPIAIAVQSMHADCLKLLISARGDVNTCANDGRSPIYDASQNGFADCLAQLVSAGGDVNKCTRGGHSPIWVAASSGRADCLTLLISAGGDVNKCDDAGTSPIFVAASSGFTDCLAQLVSAGGDIDKCRNGDCSPVWIAACNGRAECLKLLLDEGGDPHINHQGISALDIARQTGHAECVRVLEAKLASGLR
jgi:ankyrin repeat protein